MDRRVFVFSITAAALPASHALSQADAASGVRAALERGAVAAVGLLGRENGFLNDARVRIPLPEVLEDAAKLLKATGQRRRVDELVTSMNRAAERAVPMARGLLVEAARRIGVDDAIRIVRGSGTSVTEYFAAQTREPLGVKFLPLVEESMKKVSLATRYNAFASKAVGFGLLKKEDANLEQYITGKALDGLFLMIGEEEKKIRADPVRTGSRLLQAVFGR
ncbi:MAG: DUF4197 domain-containing protein [Betaproteobacteria bacterium]|nr:DUF4197 domain-containing protein [Betaproteobacteria bacterium]MCC6246716.1 DUF4197 domain-containing protein [Rubrivivax sp.]